MKAIYFDGNNGEISAKRKSLPNARQEALEKRDVLLDRASLFSDALTEAIWKTVTEELIYGRSARGRLRCEITPVFIGSAFKNKGVQPCSTPCLRYLPAPLSRKHGADLDNDEEPKSCSSPTPMHRRCCWPLSSTIAGYGQLTYVRVYQGTIAKGDELSQHPHGKSARRPPGPHARRRNGRHRPAPAAGTSSPCSASTALPATPSADGTSTTP